jgi:15-cis-phytoene synthase
MAADFGYCERLVRERDKDRFLASLFAPADRRPDLLALYAFDLETMAIAQRVRDPVAGEIRFQWWHDTLAGKGEARGHPVAEALLAALSTQKLSPEPALALIDARRTALYSENMSEAECELLASETDALIILIAAEMLSGARSEAVRLAAHHAGSVALAARLEAAAVAFDRSAFIRRHLAAVQALIGQVPQAAYPAFLPLALVERSLSGALPQWRRQWM